MEFLYHKMRNIIFILSLVLLQTSVSGMMSFSGRRLNGRDDSQSRNNRIAYACQDTVLTLNCSSYNGVIRIIRANYGRFVLSTCNPWSITSGWDLQCSAKESFITVAERCDGRTECSILASNQVFQDKCPTTFKYLEVYHYCERTEPTTSVTSTTSTTTTPTPTTTTASTEKPTTKPTEVTTSGCDCYIPGTFTCDVRSKECLCRENFTGAKCDQCDHGYYKFPECEKCDCVASATTKKEICSAETGQCFCGPSLTPSCDQCLPGFVHYPFCQAEIQPPITDKPTTSKPTTSEPTTAKPKTSSPHSIKYRTTAPTQTTSTKKAIMYTCKAAESNGIWWPVSMPGIVERDCPNTLSGKMTWKCTKRGWKKEPDLSNCVSPWLDNLEDLIDASSSVEDIASTLHERTSNKRFSSGDLKMTAINLFPKLNKQLKLQVKDMTRKERRQTVDKFSKSVLQTGSNLLKDQESWKGLPQHERRRVATSLVVNMEETGFHIADSLEVGDPPVITKDDNIFMEINAIKVEENEMGKLRFPSESVEPTGDSVSIPVESLKTSTSDGEVRIVFLIYKNLNEFMSPTDHEEDIDSDYGNDGKSENASYINTNIFSAAVNGRKTKLQLSKPMTFTLKHNQTSTAGFQPVCSYWQFNDSLAGQWANDGCTLVHTNETHTTCQCDHMTNFAVLMDVVGTKLSIEHQVSLTAITYLGCIVSITCLLLCLFTFSFFKNLQCDRNTIHKNLCLSLMLAEIVFIVGINLTQFKVVCAVVAGLLHFLFLAAFSWMCLEGVQLYVMLIEVFESERSRRLWYYLFGYGIPTIIVGVSAGVDHEGYGTEKHCWLKTENYFIWSFVGPAVFVMFINVIMLSIAVYMMCRHSNTLASSLRTKEKTRLQKISGEPNSGSSSGSSADKTKSHLSPEIPSWIKGAVVLVVLLGLTWSFGVLFINEESVVMAYLFTILNTLQGVFIFIFHCVMNEKVKKEYKKFAYRATWLPGCVRNIFTGYSGSMSSPNHSSSSGGNLLKFWSGRRRRKSSGSTLDKTSTKGKKRRSDIRSSEVESFSHSISNHGQIYSPPSNNYNNGYTHGYMYSQPVQGEGIVGDLSVAECSVIDSEYVTEYCHNNMKVCNEKKEYSSESEEECVENNEHKNRLSVLSEDSAVKNSDFVSTEAEHSFSELSDDETDKSQPKNAETEPLFSKTNSEKNLVNNMVITIDADSKKCPSTNEIRLLDLTEDNLSKSTPNMKLIQGFETLLDSSSNQVVVDNIDETGNVRKPVTRHQSDPHHYELDYSEC